MSRRGALALCGGAALLAVAGWAFLVEPQRLQRRHVRLPLPGLHRSVRVLLLSDVDFPSSERRERKVGGAAAAFRPDVVLVAGDLLDRVENVRREATATAAARWVAGMGPRAYLAAGEEESPSSEALARVWHPLGLTLLTNQARTLRVGEDAIDLFVADHRLDSPPWALAREGERPSAVQAGRPVHGFLYSTGVRDWEGTETTLLFRLDGKETYLDLHLGWSPEDGPAARQGFKVGRFEEEPAFRLAHGGERVSTGFVPRPGVWTHARLRLAPEGERLVLSARFWEEGRPEPPAWQARLAVLREGKGCRGRFAIGGRRGGRAVAALRVAGLDGALVEEERFDDAGGFRRRWSDTSLLEHWQRTRDPSRPAILLAHHPDVVLDSLRAGGALPDLVLAGHTHGGQIRLPFLGALFTSTALGRRFDAGLFRVGGIPLYITAGVGTSIVPARFLAPPEVVLLELEPTDALAGGQRPAASRSAPSIASMFRR